MRESGQQSQSLGALKTGQESRLPAEADRLRYQEQGYLLASALLTEPDLQTVAQDLLALINQRCATNYPSLEDPALAHFFSDASPLCSEIYDAARTIPAFNALARHPLMLSYVRTLLQTDQPRCYVKKTLRIDAPNVIKELAHWHQDYHYVGGNTDVITAWIALQETTWFNGCLSVMPGTHRLGVVAHTLPVEKRKVPTTIFHRPVQYVEMRRGDVLFFNSLLLHSSNMNFSESTRYSLQYRYSTPGLPTGGDVHAV